MTMNLTRRTATAIALAAGLAMGMAATTPAIADDKADWPASIKVGTASQGGTYFVYGAGWANLVQETTGVNASSEVTGGPVQNFALVHTNDLQAGMTTMGPAREAWDGNSPIAPGVEMRDVRAMFPMYETPFHVIALESSGISQVADLDGKNVGVGPRGGTCGTYFPRFFEALGISITPQFGGASDLAGQVKDGLIDAFAFCGGLPIAAFSELDAQNDVNIFAFTEEEQATLVENFPVSPFTIQAGLYDSLPDEEPSVSMWNFAIVHKDLPEGFVYEIMNTVMDNNDRMLQVHKASAFTLPENMVHNNFLPFHPGAVRYFEEKGFEVPEDLKG